MVSYSTKFQITNASKNPRNKYEKIHEIVEYKSGNKI